MELKEIYNKTEFPFIENNGSYKAIPVSISNKQRLLKSNPISLVKNQYALNELNKQNDFIDDKSVKPPKKESENTTAEESVKESTKSNDQTENQ